jgi:4-aminobutyrate aminotransferase-like enzyme
MWAVEFTSDIGEQITNEALASGLLVNNVRPNAVRIVPPLTISEEDLEQGLAIIEHVIESHGSASK